MKEEAMVSHDELERLSRYLADELEPGEASALERELKERAELADALASMRALEAQLPALDETLEEAAASALVSGVLQHRSRSVLPWAALAAGLVAVAAYAFVEMARPQIVAV